MLCAKFLETVQRPLANGVNMHQVRPIHLSRWIDMNAHCSQSGSGLKLFDPASMHIQL